MSDSCNCCSGCFSRWSTASYKNSFTKKLLVAVSVLIIITMCLMPAEARSVEHRRRHPKRQLSTHHHPTTEPLLKQTKSFRTELFKNATRKIKHKLRNTKRFFDQNQKVSNETRLYRSGNPKWLPKVKFADFHNNEASIPEQKFTYLMPKLYKSLKEYEVIFNLLLNVQVNYSDSSFENYTKYRKTLLSDTLDKLRSTILEIQDNMYAVNMAIPTFEKKRMKLDGLKMKVDATQCKKNDYIAFRGYGNLLNNWYCEFRSPSNKKGEKKCAVFHAKVKRKSSNK